MRAGDPAIEGDREYQQTRAHLPPDPGTHALPGHCERRTNGDRQSYRPGHMARRIGVAVRGQQIERLRRSLPFKDDLEQRDAAPTQRDHQHQGHRELA